MTARRLVSWLFAVVLVLVSFPMTSVRGTSTPLASQPARRMTASIRSVDPAPMHMACCKPGHCRCCMRGSSCRSAGAQVVCRCGLTRTDHTASIALLRLPTLPTSTAILAIDHDVVHTVDRFAAGLHRQAASVPSPPPRIS